MGGLEKGRARGIDPAEQAHCAGHTLSVKSNAQPILQISKMLLLTAFVRPPILPRRR